MEENSNSSSTNSHSDENKSPAGDPNTLPFTKVEVENHSNGNKVEAENGHSNGDSKNGHKNGDSPKKTAEKRKAEEDAPPPKVLSQI